jgi:hypothetical protein
LKLIFQCIATWVLGTNSIFSLRLGKITENLDRVTGHKTFRMQTDSEVEALRLCIRTLTLFHMCTEYFLKRERERYGL